MALPPEVRVNIYKYISPVNTRPAESSGLCRTCRLIHKEWNWEARKSVFYEHDRFERYLASSGIQLHESAAEMLSTSSITIELPLEIFSGSDACALNLIPWHWTWITNVNIIFSQTCPPAPDRLVLMYYLYDCLDKRMNNYIAGHTARKKLDHFTIRNIALRWYGVPKCLFTRHRDKQSNNKIRR